MACLSEINWSAVQARDWQSCREPKQAEFLIESQFPWHLVERICVQSLEKRVAVAGSLANAFHKPVVEVKPEWYY